MWRLSGIAGMVLFAVTAGLFLLSSGVQTALIFLQQSGGRLSGWWGPRAFSIYNAITLIPWAAFVLAYLALQFTQHPSLPWESLWIQVIGGILISSGVSLALWVAILMGPARLNGLRHFAPASREEQVTTGPYKWLKNPMYTGYFLVLLGIALWMSSLFDLAIALESLLLLNGFQARIENRMLS